jgi:plasmid replication initiation protein
MYEYLKSIHYKKLKPYTQTLTIDKFQKIVGSAYAEFKDFHTRVLKPAQKEINQYSDIIFDYELIKEGRKTTAITITIATKESVERWETSLENERLLDERTKPNE